MRNTQNKLKTPINLQGTKTCEESRNEGKKIRKKKHEQIIHVYCPTTSSVPVNRPLTRPISNTDVYTVYSTRFQKMVVILYHFARVLRASARIASSDSFRCFSFSSHKHRWEASSSSRSSVRTFGCPSTLFTTARMMIIVLPSYRW